jgi:phytanoyl-CoA hydroxylase
MSGSTEVRARAGDARADDLLEVEFLQRGFVLLPRAVDDALIEDFLVFEEAAWHKAPPGAFALQGSNHFPLDPMLRAGNSRVADLHYGFSRSAELLFPAPVQAVLRKILRRAPVVIQTTFHRRGSEVAWHVDADFLSVSEPGTLIGTWTALEDVHDGAGELWLLPGSHQIRFAIEDDPSTDAAGSSAQTLEDKMTRCFAACLKAGCVPEPFFPRRGDVLIWSGQLMHCGAPIRNAEATRCSLISHFIPFGAMPTFYDTHGLKYAAYPGGSYRLNRFDSNG